MSKVSQTFEFNFKFNDNDASKQLKAISNDAKNMIANLGNASDKMAVFKEITSYISNLDKALATFKSKNKNAFDQMFGSFDTEVLKELEKLFGMSNKDMANLGGLRQRIQDASDSKAKLETLRTIAEDINNLFVSMGKNKPIDIDKLFTGKGSKKEGTDFANRIQILLDTLDNFAVNFQDVQNRLQGGLHLGGISTGLKRDTDEISAQIDSLTSQLNNLKKLKSSFASVFSAIKKYQDGDGVFESTKIFTQSDIAKELKDFSTVRKELDEFEKSNGDKTSIEYKQLLSDYLQQATRFASMYTMLKTGDNNKLWKQIKNKKNSQGKTLEELLKKYKDFAFGSLDEGHIDEFFSFKDSLDGQIDTITKNISTLKTEIGSMGHATKEALDSVNAGEAIKQIDQVGKHAVDTTEYIRGMALALKEMFDIMSKPMTAEYKILINGQDINVKKGQNEEINSTTMAEAFLSNLDKDVVVSAHSHMGRSTTTNHYDFKNIMDDYYSGAAKLGALVGHDSIMTLDLNGIPIEDARVALEEIEKLTNKAGSVNYKQVNDIFKAINPEYTSVAKFWEPEKFDGLAKFIYEVGQRSSEAITPVDRFQNVLKTFVKNIDLSKYQDLLSDFKEENAGNIFNKIMESEGMQLRVQDVSKGSISDVTKEIKEQKEELANLRKEAGITYEQIFEEVSKYYETHGTKGNVISDFFKKYFHVSEIPDIDKMLFDVSDGDRKLSSVAKAVAWEFGIDPSDIEEVEHIGNASQDAQAKLKGFYGTIEEAKSKWMRDTFSDVELVEYTERLSAARQELQAFADQGAITADEMQRVNEEFNNMSSKLKQSAQDNETDRRAHPGYYNYTYESEYENAEYENRDLRNANDELKAENEALRNKLQDKTVEIGYPTPTRERDPRLEALREERKAIKELEQEVYSSSQKAGSTVVEHTTNELDEKMKDVERRISIQQEWLRHFEYALNDDNFKSSGKKDATENLRRKTYSLVQGRQKNFANEEYGKEIAEVAWMKAYKEAQRQGVAQSSLDRYHTDVSDEVYDKSLSAIQEHYEYRQKVLAAAQEELAVLQAQRAEAIAIGNIEQERLNAQQSITTEQKAQQELSSKEQKLLATVYHGSKLPLNNVDYDASKSKGMRNLGDGMYFTPNLDLAAKHGKNILQQSVDMDKIFVLTKDFITDIDALYEIMGKVKPENVDWNTIKSTLLSWIKESPANVKKFAEQMQAKGYEGVYSKGYGYADPEAEQMVLYDNKYKKGMTTAPYKEIQISSEVTLATQQAITAEIEKQKTLGSQVADVMSGVQEKPSNNVVLNNEFALINKIIKAYHDLGNAVSMGTEGQEEDARDALKDLEDQYYSIVATMEDGSKINILLDDEFEEAATNILQQADKIQNIDFIPRTAEQAIKAYERIDTVLSNIGKYHKNLDTLEGAIHTIRPDSAKAWAAYLESSIKDIQSLDPDFKFGSQDKYEQAIKVAQKTQELYRRIQLEEDNTQEQAKAETLSKEVVQHQELLAIIEQAKQAVDTKTEAFKNEEVTVDAVVKQEVESLEKLRSYLESLRDIVQSVFGDNKTEKDLSEQELSNFNRLKEIIVDIEAAVNNKTNAFKTEATTVEQTVNDEIVALSRLESVIKTIDQALDAAFAADRKLNLPEVKVETPTVIATTSTENPHYVTNPQGVPVTMYRGIRDSYSGLVSNRYHGGTFSTDNLELAKEYAGEMGKVEKVLLSMKNPLEIDGRGALWNQIEYIGEGADDASKKLRELKEEIYYCKQEIKKLEQTPPSQKELDLVKRGLKLETDQDAKLREYREKKAKLQKEVEAIYSDESNPYGKKNTNQIVEIAKEKGYDGVIFKDIIDSFSGDVKDLSNVMVTFTKDQIHYIETIGTTFESAITSFKNRYEDLTQFIDTTPTQVRDAMEQLFNARKKFEAKEITFDEYDDIISNNNILNNLDKFIEKDVLTEKEINDSLQVDDTYLLGFLERPINQYLSRMKERLQKIAKSFGMEDVPLKDLLDTSKLNQDVVEEQHIESDKTSDAYELLANKLSNDIATEGTLSAIKNAVDQLASSIRNNDNVDSAKESADALHEAAIATESVSESVKDIVYHAGDLSNIGKTLKTLPLGNFKPNEMDLTFNGFTGLYTTENFDHLTGNEWDGAPISTIDLSYYKMFDARSDELATKAKNFFNDLNSTIYGYIEVFDFDLGEMVKKENVKTVAKVYEQFREVFGSSQIDFKTFKDFIRKSRDAVKGHAFNTVDMPDLDQGISKFGAGTTLQDVSREVFNSDTFQTQLLKMLGFEGIDLRGTKYNSAYTGGTVIFDIKPESLKSVNEKWSDVARRHHPENDFWFTPEALQREEKRRQLALDTAKAYSQQAQAKKDIQNIEDNDVSTKITGLQDKSSTDDVPLALQGIQQILEQIYGVLHGMTGIEADNKNSVKYSEPVVDTPINTQTLSEQDLSILSAILQTLKDIANSVNIKNSDNLDHNVETQSIVEPITSSLSELGILIRNAVEKSSSQAIVADSPPPSNLPKSTLAVSAQPPTSPPPTSAAGGTPPPDDPDDTASLKRVLEYVNKIKKAVNEKTKAFEKEGTTVENVVTKEIDALQKLINKLAEVKNAVDGKTQAFKDEGSAVNSEVKETVGKQSKKKSGKKKPETKKKTATKEEEERQIRLSGILKSARDGFAKSGIDTVHPEKLTKEQKAIYDAYVKIRSVIKALREDASKVTDDQINDALDLHDALIKQLDAYNKQKDAAKDANKKTNKDKTYAKNKVEAAQRRYDMIETAALPYVNEGSTVVSGQLAEYKAALQRLIDLQTKLNTNGTLSKEDFADFNLLATECNKYARAIEGVINNTEKLRESENSDKASPLNGTDVSSVSAREAALKRFVQVNYGAAAAIGNFDKNSNALNFTLQEGDGTLRKMKASLDAARTSIIATSEGTKDAQSGFGAFFDSIKNKGKELLVYASARFGIDEIIQAVRTGVQYVREIDSALTELKKVTNETDAAYDQFLQNMSKTAGVVGSTVKDLTTMAAEWARLGYTMAESAKLAESTAILLNVSEFTDATQASEALISTMQAFQYTADESQHVVDILNEVGNNYAVSSDGIATALQDSASALMEGGNTLEQATALVAAANRVVQDPSSVGSALRTISLRLRGTSVEILEEMGEETDGVVESTSKLQAQLKALTGVDILTDTGAYKDTYTILKEIGAVWKDMESLDQAAALELMAGKNRANTLSAILNNMKDLEGAYESALNAEGSALKENAAYLDSIQGRVDLLMNAVQTMWMNFIDTDVAKFLVDVVTALVKLVDTIGLIPSVAGVFAAYKIGAKELKQAFESVSDAIVTGKEAEAAATKKAAAADIQEGIASKQNADENKKEAVASEQVIQNKVKEEIQLKKVTGATSRKGTFTKKQKVGDETTSSASGLGSLLGLLSGKISKKAITGLQAIAKTLGKTIKIIAIAEAVMWALGKAWDWVDQTVNHVEYLRQEIEDLTNTYESAKKSFDDNLEVLTTSSDSKVYATLQDEFNELTKGVDKYGNNISLTADQYERYKEICEQIVGINPLIASGYDSATEAIGNNAGVLSQLIELQKEQARLAAKEYISDDNLKILSEGAVSDFEEANSEMSKVTSSMNQNLAGFFNDILKFKDADKDNSYEDDTIEYILEKLGYDQAAINKALNEYQGHGARAGFDMSSFWSDYSDEIRKNIDHFGAEYADDLSDIFASGELEIKAAQKRLSKTRDGFIDELLVVPTSSEDYAKLSSESKNFLVDWIKNGDIFKVDGHLDGEKAKDLKNTILNMMYLLVDEAKNITYNGEQITAQDLLAKIYNFDKSASYTEYKTQINAMLQAFWNSIGGDSNKYGFKDFDGFKVSLGFNFEQADKDLELAKKQVAEFLEEDVNVIQDHLNKMNVTEVQAFYSINWNEVGKDGITSWQDVLHMIKGKSHVDVASVKTHLDLSTSVDSYNELLTQTNTITADNIEVTQEYKDSLDTLGVTEEELIEIFGEENGLIVKNSKKLRELVKEKKKTIAADVKLAKAQSQLEYYELVKELGKTLDVTEDLSDQSRLAAYSLLDQIDAVRDSIYQYQLLEDSLLGAANAFEKFAKAQELDAKNTYGDSYVEMAQTMYDALYKTGEVGTPQFWAAAEALVPDDVYKHLEEGYDQIKAIFDYARKNVFSTLTLKDDEFTLDFDAIENFIEKAQKADIFTKTGTKKFELSEEFLNSIKDGENGLKQFAEAMGMTETQAYAMLAEFDRYNTDGNDLPMLFQMDKTLTGKITNVTNELASLNEQKLALLDNGGYEQNKKKIDEIDKLIKAQEANLATLEGDAVKSVQEYAEINNALIQTGKTVKEVLPEKVYTDLGLTGTEKVEEVANILQSRLLALEEPTTLTLEIAQEDIEAEIKKIEEADATISAKVEIDDETGFYKIKDGEEYSVDLQHYVELKNDQLFIDSVLEQGIVSAEEYLKNIETTVKAIADKIKADVPANKQPPGTSKPGIELPSERAKREIKQKESEVKAEIAGRYTQPKPIKEAVKETILSWTIPETKGDPEFPSWADLNNPAGRLKRDAILGNHNTGLDSMMPQYGPEYISPENIPSGNTKTKEAIIEANNVEVKPIVGPTPPPVVAPTPAPLSDPYRSGVIDTVEITEFKDFLQSKIAEVAQKYNQSTNGNFDYTKAYHATPAEMQVHYPEFSGSVATTYDRGFTIADSDGRDYSIVVSCITPDGEILDENSLSAYVNGVLSGANNILEADKVENGGKGLLINIADGVWDPAQFDAFNDTIKEYKDQEAQLYQLLTTGTLDNPLTISVQEISDYFNVTGEELDKLVQSLENTYGEFINIGSQAQEAGNSAYDMWQKYAKNTAAISALNEIEEKTTLLNAEQASALGITIKEDEFISVGQAYTQLLQQQQQLATPTEITAVAKLAIDDIDAQIQELQAAINNNDFSNVDPVSVGVEVGQTPTKEEVEAKLAVLKQDMAVISTTFDIELNEEQKSLVKSELESIDTYTIDNKEFKVSVDGVSPTTTSLTNIKRMLDDIKSKTVTITTVHEQKTKKTTIVDTVVNAGKTAVDKVINRLLGDGVVNGTAHAGGSWGAPKTETSLVGELGPEMRVRGNRWELIGQNGAEFTDVRKGDIIFNHKQTEDLLSHGYVTGRGKAYAEGTIGGSAYAGLWKPTSPDKSLSNTAGNELSSAAGKVSSAASSVSDAADEFLEVFDWIEVRLEEINEKLGLLGAELENTVGATAQNKVIDAMIDANKTLYNNLIAGANEYYAYAKNLLAKVPSEYRKAAQNGSIAIETFVGEVDEETLKAIQDYREWVQKGADATQQAEETLTEISSLAKQAIDNIAADYDNKASLRDSKIEQYEAYNSLLETDQGFESEKIYQAMIKEANSNLKTLEQQSEKMQAELNKRVQAGEIEKYSQDWYDAINDIADVDAKIIELQTDTENWQDKINELHWDKLDLLIKQLESVSDEADNLIDILSNKDVVDDAGAWTKEGIASLGLYAQKMEVAEVQAKKYKEEINYLNKNWQKLGYTEEEYIDKLDELKSAQYDSIQAYYEAKDAIVDLNAERVEAIKDGIQKEIDAYTKLIEKKKEALDADKDLYEFEKTIAEQTKSISDLERQLAALAGDNSASARAQRAQLQAELAKAKADLEDSYYDRSMSNQQEALDKELEHFQDTKDKEMEGWDEYLENTEQVVSDSLTTIQSNTDVVYQTLKQLGNEYSLSITESLTSPWKEGENAIQSFSEKFGVSMSATVTELEELAIEFKETMAEIEQAGTEAVTNVKNNAKEYQSANNPSVMPGDKDLIDESGNSGNGSGGGSSSSGGSYPYGKASGTSGNIKKGAKGNDVKAIQYALNKLGYGNSGTSKVDGIFGSGTHSAVKSFQKAMGISADGIVGKNTRAKFKAKGYALGTTSVPKSDFAWVDELGEELILRPQNGRLTFLEKGTGVIPADATANLMQWSTIDPTDMLERNRPQIGMSPSVINNTMEINVDASVGTLLAVENFNGDDPAEVAKMINKALEQHTKNLNASLKKFVR